MRLSPLALVAILACAIPAIGQQDPTPATPPPAGTPKQPVEPKTLPPALPADKSVPQSITVNGRTLAYTATVGTIALKAQDGKASGEVTYVAYTV